VTQTVSSLPPLDKHRVASLAVGAAWIVIRVVVGAEGLRYKAEPGVHGALAGLLEGVVVLIPIGAIWFAEPLAGGVLPTLARIVAWVALFLLTVGQLLLLALLAPR
jgi:hypothetical protein